MEDIYILRRMIQSYHSKKNDLYMVFIDVERAYGRVSKEILWKVLEKIGVKLVYIQAIKEMYVDVVTFVRTPEGLT